MNHFGNTIEMNDGLGLKQLVPSAVCLTCEGCCRYDVPDSLWRPKWDKREFLDDNDYVTTIQECGKHLCRFLKAEDNTCRVYADRPFECALYPFVLSQNKNAVDVYLHLACPFVQDNQDTGLIEEYIHYLEQFFQAPECIAFLKRQRHLIHDYAPVAIELKYVFTIQAAI